MARLDFCLPGSLVERTTRCGTPTCRCETDPARATYRRDGGRRPHRTDTRRAVRAP
ncbi:MAG: DUF6788 family protein [Acidimicrobiales bacterium]